MAFSKAGGAKLNKNIDTDFLLILVVFVDPASTG